MTMYILKTANGRQMKFYIKSCALIYKAAWGGELIEQRYEWAWD